MKTAGRIVMVMMLLTGLQGSTLMQAEGSAERHFNTVWQGENGTGHMNFYIIGATLDGESLEAGDEIAVCSGDRCVGSAMVTGTIAQDNVESFISIIASMDDGTGNGFEINDTVLFRIWDSSENKEYGVKSASFRNDLSTWRHDGRFESGASSFLNIESESAQTQTIQLKSGWNLISSNIVPEDPSMETLVASLIANETLVTVQDQFGNTLENWGEFGGWINHLGDFDNQQGYKIFVTEDCEINITGQLSDTPEWDGQGFIDYMNFNVYNASIDGKALQPGDKITLWSGDLSVGTGLLEKVVSENDTESFVSIIASMDDGNASGFTMNDTILFKIWDSSENKEYSSLTVIYRNDLSTWSTDGKYQSGASSFVSLSAKSLKSQSIQLKSGWNLISSNLVPYESAFDIIMADLMEQNKLIKVKDQYGNTLENWGDLGGWVNNIGHLDNKQGYQIYVTEDCEITFSGQAVELPMDIQLEEGWNTISFPYTETVDGENFLRTLIDAKVLLKAQDEQGNSIENWGIEAGWVNNIGVFEPGRAYEVKVSENSTLSIGGYYLKSTKLTSFELQPVHFIVGFEGNGLQHMNINILSFSGLGMEAGDEIGVFDGDLCVGVVKLTAETIDEGKVSVNASRATPGLKNGFLPGKEITIKVWRERLDEELVMVPEVVSGELLFNENETVLVRLSTATDCNKKEAFSGAKVYPNPTSDWFNIEIDGEIPSGAKLQILDLSGKIIIDEYINNTLERMDVSQYTSGVYFVRLIHAGQKKVWRLNVR